MKPIENYGYQIKSYRFVGEYKFEVYLKGVKIPGVFDTYCQAEQYCKDEIINDAADKYVFDEAPHNSKWSNNDDTAGDNFGSFKAGAQWAISQMQPEWVACSERLPGQTQYTYEVCDIDDTEEEWYLKATWSAVRKLYEKGRITHYKLYVKSEPPLPLSKCERYGHSLQPVVGFDNEITDYQCLGCGILESNLPQPPTK